MASASERGDGSATSPLTPSAGHPHQGVGDVSGKAQHSHVNDEAQVPGELQDIEAGKAASRLLWRAAA